MLTELRESLRLEDQADLYAASGQFGAASDFMKRANRIREAHFGKFDPNELRRRTQDALRGQP